MLMAVLLAGLIFSARIVDVSLATLRTIAIVNGRRGLAWGLGFGESLVWILAVSRVFAEVQNQNVLNIMAWSLGYATGSYVGLVIENWFALGQQAVRIFTRNPLVAADLRELGFGVTQYVGHGRDGAVLELFVNTPRRGVRRLLATARELDKTCFYTIEDIRLVSQPQTIEQPPRGWRRLLVRK
ncbi:MAG: DUF2179 domain-containing protein [Phycisphaerae bacterium]|nr:DUF2179 domain-containing protein [Phycisphaerae bacterium]